MAVKYSKTVHIAGEPITNLNAKEYEDPRDAACLSALKLNKNLDKLIKYAYEYGLEKVSLIQYVGSYVQVTEKNLPYLYGCVKSACEILCVEEIPNIYIVQDPYLNAATQGAKHPILILHDSLIKRLTHEELMFVIGHEIGHIKSEHCLYQTIGRYLKQAMEYGACFIPAIGSIISNVLGTGLNIAIYDWMRKSELTADRAGLLVCQDLKAAVTTQMKLSGYPEEFYEYMDVNEFLKQAQNFDDLEEETYNKLIKTCVSLDMSHPWSVQRAKELMLWVESGEYSRIRLRCSTWLSEQLADLEEKSDEAKSKHYQRKSHAKTAMDELNKNSFEYEEEPKGAKAVFIKGQKNIRNIQNKIDEAAAKRKAEKAEDAKEDMYNAFKNEKSFRALYNPTPEEYIRELTDKTIGDLQWISE